MITALALLTVAAVCINTSCSNEQDVVRDRPRQTQIWNYPDDFEPSHITTDDDGNRWGLFVSRRFSGKESFWAVRSIAGGEWSNPILLMNAYYFTELKFEAVADLLRLTFIEIDENYFYDYDRYLDQAPEFPETVVVELRLDYLTKDRDRDGLPDLLEKEMLLSSRLPDSDVDGKPDNVDFCPLGVPVSGNNGLDIYRTALVHLMQLDNIVNLSPAKDTAWTRFYGTYYIHEPTIAYVAFPGEPVLPELTDLPIVLIQVKSPLYFGGKPQYGSFTGGIVPHLIFYKPEIDIFGRSATMKLELVERVHRRESATMHLAKSGEQWVVKQVTQDD
jgi:hypothetical protein